MMTIMNSVQKTEIKDIFGVGYCTLNDEVTLTDNYNSILSQRGYLLSKLYYFLDNSALSSMFALSVSDIDLLCFNCVTPPNIDQHYFPQYCNYEELSLFRLLKKIAINKEEVTEDDYFKLYSFTRNRKRVEDIIEFSTYNKLLLDKKTIEQLLSLITKRTLPNGHVIRLYESLCHDLNLTSYDTGHKLEYKYNN